MTLAPDVLPLRGLLLRRGNSLLDVLHDLGSLDGGNFLTEAEVESLKGEQPLEMPALTLASGLGLHGLELGLPLFESSLFPSLFLVRAETLNWGMDFRRRSLGRYAVRTDDALQLFAMSLYIIETLRARHHRILLELT